MSGSKPNHKEEKPNQKKKHRLAKVSTVFQMEATECGAASLGMIMQYYGVYIPLENLRVDTGVSRDGCKASKILQGARKHFFETCGYRMSEEALFETKPPCIIHWNYNHFLVYEGKKGKYVYLNDPAQGPRKVTIEEFAKSFTGIVLTITPTENIVKSKGKKTLLYFIKERLNNQYQNIAYLFLVGFMLVLPGIILPSLSKYFINTVLVSGNGSGIGIILISMALVGLFRSLLTFYRDFIVVKLQLKTSLISSFSFIRHMMKLPMIFFSQRFTGDLIGRVENNDSVNEFLTGDLATNALNIFVAFFYLVVMFLYSPELAFLGLSFVVINFVILKLTSAYFSRTIFKVQQDQGKMLGILYSGIDIISTLKASGIEDKYVGRVLGYYSKYIIGKQRNGKLQMVLNALPDIASQICDVLVLVIGGGLVIAGRLSIGDLVAFYILLGAFIRPVNELMRFTEKIQKIKADMSRVEDILQYNQNNEMDKHPELKQQPTGKLEGQVTMNSIYFGYSPLEKPLIENFSFDLEPGKSIAFVGSSGSGKSTISKILSGLYSPWSGEVLFDGSLNTDISQEVLSVSIATVSQDISLFSGSIRDNITLWNKAVRDEDIIRATKDAMIHEDITAKPNAYDFQLEKSGRNLSGGQRQRIEIARALALNPSVIIMDEATSALDALTEKEIIDNIKRRGCTCVIIAHRLSAIRDCDEIIVLDAGSVVQRGNHETLISSAGAYKALFDANH